MKGLGFIAVMLVTVGCAQTYQHSVVGQDRMGSDDPATVRIPNRVEVLSVDGTRVQTRSLLQMRESHVLLLEPGSHRITARPRATLDLHDEDHGVTVPTATRILFDVEPDETYRIVYDPTLRTDREKGESMWVEILLDE